MNDFIFEARLKRAEVMFFPNWMKRSSHVHAENDNENAYSSSFSEVKSLLKMFRQFHHKLSYRIRLSSFFLRLASSDRPQFMAF